MSPATEASVNIASHLPRLAREAPDRPALRFMRGGAARTWSFKELNDASDRAARGLAAAGLRRGARTVLMVKPGPEFFALTFALYKLGAPPVLVDPGMGRANLGTCLREARPEAFIGVPLAHAARVLLGWGSATLKLLVTVGPRLGWGGLGYDELLRLGSGAPYPMADTGPDETAAILFTSGSTGVPKGAVYTHGMFDAQVRFLREHFRVRPGETDLPTFPLFALFNPALGMTAVIPEMDFTRPGSVDPEAILEPLRRWDIEQMFGSPALLDRVGRWGAARGVKLPALKRVITAGAPVPPAVLERFAKLLPPDARIHTPYGATEALPVASITHAEVLGETAALSAEGRGTCVGRPLPGVRVDVVRIDDGPLPDWSDSLRVPVGAVGEFVVRGPQVTREYFGRPEADALAKIRWPDGSVGHRMGDLGWLDERGRLWFCGRKSHRVRTATGVLFTVPCESVFNRHPKVRRTALVGVGEPGRQRPVLCVELEEGARPSDALEEELLALGARHEHTRGVRDVLFHPSFPVDIRHNAKIFREKLAVWAAREL